MNDVGRRLDWGLWNTFMKSTSIAFQWISQHLLTGRGMLSRDLLMPLSFSHPACKTRDKYERLGHSAQSLGPGAGIVREVR